MYRNETIKHCSKDKNQMKMSSTLCFPMNSLQQSSQSVEMENICELPYSDPERVVGYMRSRFFMDKAYTWAGNVLLYTQTYKALNRTKKEKPMDDGDTPFTKHLDDPSIESIVNRLWFRMQNQITEHKQAAIVVSGESGAGKTYSTCLAIKAIANKVLGYSMKEGEDDHMWRVWASVPLLNAFGNAATLLNSNSSRFGKLQRLQFASGKLTGASIETYLIEKSRVVDVSPGEGNFHIFRQILNSLPWEELNALHLSRECEYQIAPNIGFKSTFEETVKSLEILNMQEQLPNILKTLSIILNLGNVTFVPENDCSFLVHPASQIFLENAANLLIVPLFSLHDILCNIHYVTNQSGSSKRMSFYKSPCTNAQECAARRDCIMKLLYEGLFRWLVNAINDRIVSMNADQYINLLDIYGFESFAQNRFEQLCINYANERLQEYFNKGYLEAERDELVRDGIQMDKMDAIMEEYKVRIRILDGVPSLFSILNEECAMKRFNSATYVTQRFGQNIRKSKHFWIDDDSKALFTIRHYAGCVKYDATGMVTKNLDKVPEDISNFLKNSQWTFIPALIGSSAKTERTCSNRQTVLSYFKNSFDKLEMILNKSDVHYIKCLKANSLQMAEIFDDEYFTKQLLSNGIFEILKLSFQTYSIKLPKALFMQRMGEESLDILKNTCCDEFYMDKLTIYLNENVFDFIVNLRRLKHDRAARRIQKAWHKYAMKRIRAAEIIQSFVRQNLFVETVRRKFSNADKIGHVESFLLRNSVEVNFEGDPISLTLEKFLNQTETIKFRRNVFMAEGIFSRYNITDISKTGRSSGLIDIF